MRNSQERHAAPFDPTSIPHTSPGALMLRRKCATAVRIGTLSWPGDVEDVLYLEPKKFLKTLRQVTTHTPPKADLILCAGRRLQRLPSAVAVMDATRGIPVLFEVKERMQRRPTIGSWYIFHAGSTGPQ